MAVFQVTLAPWLVELSHKYFSAARLLAEARNLLGVAEVNAALSVELLLKSFLVKAVADHGTVYERYERWQGSWAHDLMALYEKLPLEVQEAIFTAQSVHWIAEYRHTFTKARYEYEVGAPLSSSSILIDVAGELIPRTVRFYRSLGCKDPWIVSYQEPVHPYVLVKI